MHRRRVYHHLTIYTCNKFSVLPVARTAYDLYDFCHLENEHTNSFVAAPVSRLHLAASKVFYGECVRVNRCCNLTFCSAGIILYTNFFFAFDWIFREPANNLCSRLSCVTIICWVCISPSGFSDWLCCGRTGERTKKYLNGFLWYTFNDYGDFSHIKRLQW